MDGVKPKPLASSEITALLAAAARGEPGALDRLMPVVYEQLRQTARGQLRRLRLGQTLDTTALVHEAYFKLADRAGAGFQDRAHFFSVAAVAMRHILVDEARRRATLKRSGAQVTLDPEMLKVDAKAVDILAVDEALRALEKLDARQARLVELRYFGGLTEEETAHELQVTARTVRRDWSTARAFLARALATSAE